MKTLTALFDDYEDAARAVRALEAAEIPADAISLVVSTLDDAVGAGDPETAAAEEAAAGAGIGAVVGGASGLLAGLGAFVIPGLGPVVAAGWLLSAAVGAVAGAALGGATGGIVGLLTNSGVHEHDAHVFAEGVRRGGNVVSVRAEDSQVRRVEDIFNQSNRADIEQRRRLYEDEGWQHFDPDGQPYAEDPLHGGPIVGNFRGPY
ncbi:hypothetical protein [Devosia sp.]|uniref:hypothetical protein n=1 Tax=Devosia sp. TaxID=1871048 RepID=UPI0032663CE5